MGLHHAQSLCPCPGRPPAGKDSGPGPRRKGSGNGRHRISEPPAGIPDSLPSQILRLPRISEPHHHPEPRAFPHDLHGTLLPSRLLPQKTGKDVGRLHGEPVWGKAVPDLFRGIHRKGVGKVPQEPLRRLGQPANQRHLHRCGAVRFLPAGPSPAAEKSGNLPHRKILLPQVRPR